MKSQLVKFVLPIGMGLVVTIITIMGFSTIISSCKKGDVCESKSGSVTCGYCKLDAATSSNPNAGKCFYCPSGSTCSGDVCGNVQCISAGGGGGGGGTAYCNPGNTYNYSSQKCCPNSAPYYYPGTHGIKGAGCYSSCPYVGDCGSKFTKY